MNPIANQLKWLIAIRLVVITSVALPAFLFQLSNPSGPTFGRLYLLAGVTYLLSLVYLGLLVFLNRHLTLQAYFQFIGDLLMVTALIRESGGVSSPFSLLYLIVISVAATMLRRRAGLIVAGIAWTMYAGLLMILYLGGSPAGAVIETWRLIYNLLIHAFGFYAVARLISYLAENVTRAELELVEKSRDLAELEAFSTDVIESMTSGLITTDLDDVIISVNRAGRQILGWEEDELIGRSVLELGLFEDRDWARLRQRSEAGSRIRDEVTFRRDNELLCIGFSISSLLDEQGKGRGRILIFQDLSEWRKLQEEVQLKERMAAVGELAAGLAHEIGNPLAAISGSVQMLTRSSSEDSSQRRLLDIVLAESKRLDRTIKSFLRYARPKERSDVRFDIGELLKENVELLRNSEEVGEQHHLELQLEPESSWLVGDRDQITQIFWNLVRNALRAMPEGGTLRVSGTMRGETYSMRVVDTGMGMGTEERANLFHPFKSFFDGGAGIGMAIVYRIVEEHGGRISVESSEGDGTSITVELPVLDAASIAVGT